MLQKLQPWEVLVPLCAFHPFYIISLMSKSTLTRHFEGEHQVWRLTQQNTLVTQTLHQRLKKHLDWITPWTKNHIITTLTVHVKAGAISWSLYEWWRSGWSDRDQHRQWEVENKELSLQEMVWGFSVLCSWHTSPTGLHFPFPASAFARDPLINHNSLSDSHTLFQILFNFHFLFLFLAYFCHFFLQWLLFQQYCRCMTDRYDPTYMVLRCDLNLDNTRPLGACTILWNLQIQNCFHWPKYSAYWGWIKLQEQECRTVNA